MFNYDIILIFLYESWANEHTQISINGYTCLIFFRKFQHKKSKRCSGGIVVYIKECLQKGIYVYKTYHDAIIWIKLDKNFFGLDMNIFLAGVFTLNETYKYSDFKLAGKLRFSKYIPNQC
jgi:hypothetical protein